MISLASFVHTKATPKSVVLVLVRRKGLLLCGLFNFEASLFALEYWLITGVYVDWVSFRWNFTVVKRLFSLGTFIAWYTRLYVANVCWWRDFSTQICAGNGILARKLCCWRGFSIKCCHAALWERVKTPHVHLFHRNVILFFCFGWYFLRQVGIWLHFPFFWECCHQ